MVFSFSILNRMMLPTDFHIFGMGHGIFAQQKLSDRLSLLDLRRRSAGFPPTKSQKQMKVSNLLLIHFGVPRFFHPSYFRISSINHPAIGVPSGYLLHSHGKIHPCLSSVNHLFLWAIYTMRSIAPYNNNYQPLCINCILILNG